MSKESNDNGKPTCCGPGDLSACVIETAKKPKKNQSEADLQAESSGTDAQPEAADTLKSGGRIG